MSEATAAITDKGWSIGFTPAHPVDPSPCRARGLVQLSHTAQSTAEAPSARIDTSRLLAFLHRYPQAWQTLRETVGHDEAVRLAQLRRNDAMTSLRVEHRWSLQAIGDLFDLSRERVRQVTPAIEGVGATPDLEDVAPLDPQAVRRDLESLFKKAVHHPEAWNGRGQVSKPWVVSQLGYEPNLPGLDFRQLIDSKTRFLLRYGVGLRTEGAMRRWLRRMYFERHMTYADIANWLSGRFVDVAPMTVHRFATKILGIDGYARGSRPDR